MKRRSFVQKSVVAAATAAFTVGLVSAQGGAESSSAAACTTANFTKNPGGATGSCVENKDNNKATYPQKCPGTCGRNNPCYAYCDASGTPKQIE